MKKELTKQEILDKLVAIADVIDKDTNNLSDDMANIVGTLTTTSTIDDNWNDLFSMFQNIKDYTIVNGQNIVSHDNPYNLRLGYKCNNTGKTWSIKLINMKKSIDQYKNSGDEEKIKMAEMLMKAFQTQQGKENLLQVLNGK